ALRPLADGRVRADLRPDGPLAAERVGQGARVRIDTAPWAGLLRPPGTATPAQIPVAPANLLNP
ncbi:MAG: hypothetical protein KDE22_11785, partial [Rhodobacterales bacterium]|nr:hypothetical protein [Rhodobacterales bacterium]